jgi:hypothetical protein
MPAHYCIDPLDPYAEQEVLVTYEVRKPMIAIISAVDKYGFNILSELTDECVRMLQLEIAVYYGHLEPYAWAQHAIDVIAAPQAP